MIAKVIALGDDRTHAVRLLGDALRRTRLHGVRPTSTCLLGILGDEEFRAERVHTALLDERLEEWSQPATASMPTQGSSRGSPCRGRQQHGERQVLGRIPTALPQRAEPAARPLYESGATSRSGQVRHPAGRVRDRWITVVEAQPARVVLDDDGVTESTTSQSATGGSTSTVPGIARLTPIPEFVDPADVIAEGSLLAPMPAAVMSVAVTEGQRVTKGDIVVVLEAMKMQHTITAPYDGVVTELSATAGAQVESGAVLAVIEGQQGEAE